MRQMRAITLCRGFKVGQDAEPEGDASEVDGGGVVGGAASGHAARRLPLPLHDVAALRVKRDTLCHNHEPAQ